MSIPVEKLDAKINALYNTWSQSVKYFSSKIANDHETKTQISNLVYESCNPDGTINTQHIFRRILDMGIKGDLPMHFKRVQDSFNVLNENIKEIKQSYQIEYQIVSASKDELYDKDVHSTLDRVFFSDARVPGIRVSGFKTKTLKRPKGYVHIEQI